MNIFLDVFRLNEYNHNSLWIFFQKIYIQFIAFNFSRSKYSLIIRFQKDARNFVSLIFFNLFPFRRSPFLPAEFLLFSTGKFKSKLSSRKGTKYSRKIFLTILRPSSSNESQIHLSIFSLQLQKFIFFWLSFLKAIPNYKLHNARVFFAISFPFHRVNDRTRNVRILSFPVISSRVRTREFRSFLEEIEDPN